MPIRIRDDLRPVFAETDRFVMIKTSTGELQIIPSDEYTQVRAVGWERLILCEGCGLYAWTEECFSAHAQTLMAVPTHFSQLLYGRTDLQYHLCPPRHGGHPCLDLALLADELRVNSLHRHQHDPDEEVPPPPGT
ncbi:hypothetical protein [Actinomadura kijaniata]|uniref:hypothetical protein n=1 Tax=Actinomadura kijaniata TaxID=46161 RepID=UPI00082B6353|nr:hypothetical protein [Actinomadura kijaniata]